MMIGTRLSRSSSPPPTYPMAQPMLETESRLSGEAICGRNELYTTTLAPKAMLATMKSTAPSSQRVPVRKTRPMVAPDPMYASRANSCFLCEDRSAIAPVTGRTSTWRITDSETAYGYTEPGSTWTPKTWKSGVVQSLSASVGQLTARSATEVRYGPRKTERTVVENAEFAQS